VKLLVQKKKTPSGLTDYTFSRSRSSVSNSRPFDVESRIETGIVPEQGSS